MDHKLKDDTKSIESGDPKKDYEFTTCSENKDGVTFSDTNRLEIKPSMCCCYVFPYSRIHSPHHLH